MRIKLLLLASCSRMWWCCTLSSAHVGTRYSHWCWYLSCSINNYALVIRNVLRSSSGTSGTECYSLHLVMDDTLHVCTNDICYMLREFVGHKRGCNHRECLHYRHPCQLNSQSAITAHIPRQFRFSFSSLVYINHENLPIHCGCKCVISSTIRILQIMLHALQLCRDSFNQWTSCSQWHPRQAKRHKKCNGRN